MKNKSIAPLAAILLFTLICARAQAADKPAPSPSAADKPAPPASPAPSSHPLASPAPDAGQVKKDEKETQKEKDQQREKAAQMEGADFQRICANEFHLPFSRKLVFSLDGTQAYAMVPVFSAEDRGRKLVYFDLQLVGGTAAPHFGLKNTLNADLVTTLDSHGFASSVAAVILPPAFASCGRGDMELISGFTSSTGPVRRKGFLGVVPSFRVPVLYEPLNRNLLQLDTDTMQSRFLVKVPPGLHIIHVDPLGGKLTLWDNGLRTLSLTNITMTANQPANVPRKLKSIKVKDGYQILQTGARFAAMRVSATDNTITIHEIPAWTGVTKEGEYKLKLPAAFSATQAQVWPNFDRKIALVTAKTDDVRRRWQKVFLYDYSDGRLIYEFAAKGTDYFGEVGISPNTKSIVVVGMNGSQSVADKVIVRDLAKETTREIKLTSP